MGKQMRWQGVVGLIALILVGCSQEGVLPISEGAQAWAIAAEGEVVRQETQAQLIAQLENWFEAQLTPFTWEEYSYGAPEQIGTPVIKAKIRGEGIDHYEVAVITTRIAMPNAQGMAEWGMLYPHNETTPDRVRLEETYWLTYEQERQSLRPLASEDVRYQRLAYDEAAVMPESLRLAFQSLIGQPASFFQGYTQLEDDGKQKYLMTNDIDSEHYYLPERQIALRYPDSLSPYGLGEQIVIDWAGQEETISAYATQKQGRYHISVPVSLLLNHYKKVYYRYNYFVGTEDGKIEWIRLERIVQDAP
ncbi:MAG: hypothetical protein ACRCW2_09785 [Cellulosilyticaceae bacterium]